MLKRALVFLGHFILSLLCVLILSFGLSFLIVPHQSVDAYELMEKTTLQGQRITADWWDEVYIPEKHHERFAILGEERGVVFKILFLVFIPIVFCGFLWHRNRRTLVETIVLE